MEKRLEELCSEYITPSAVGKYCGVCKVTAIRWIERGHLTAFRLPEGHYRIHRDDFDKFLAEHSIPVRK